MTAPRQIVPGGPESTIPPSVRRYVPPGDTVVRAIKPHPAFILLRSCWSIVGVFVVILAVLVLDRWYPLGTWGTRAILLSLALLALRLLWVVLEWACRWYVLTDARVMRVAGVLRRTVSEVTLDSVRAAAADCPLAERLFGLGTVGFASAATGGYEVVWSTIARPHAALTAVRAQKGDTVPSTPNAPEPAPAVRPLIIGLAGGVGSGKSTVARAFERLGCIVSDSDRDTDAVLARQSTRDQLRAWWGPGVLKPDGSVDRSAVAKIVFTDPEQRRRLEGLVHPLVREARDERVAEATRTGAPAVVIDAPLLFEAGLDAECDAVVYVEAPRRVRLERVRQTRGWDAGELDRREKAQLPLEHKRSGSDHVVINSGGADEIDQQVDSVLRAIRTKHPAASRR